MRFEDSVRVPQLGWNYVEADESCRIISSGYAYFANSYCARRLPEGWSGAYADHGGRFIAGLERGAVAALQCHPELSASWGVELLQRWLKAGSAFSC